MNTRRRRCRQDRPRRSRWRGDQGAATAEFAVGAPMILMTLVILVAQLFITAMGRLAAHAAADHAVNTARVAGGDPGAAEAEAAGLLADIGGPFIADRTVQVQRGTQQTTVTVRGRARGLPIPITVTVVAPTERLTPAAATAANRLPGQS